MKIATMFDALEAEFLSCRIITTERNNRAIAMHGLCLSGLIAAAALLLATPAIFAATTTKDVEIVVTHPGSWDPEVAMGSGWGVIRAAGDVLHLAFADGSGMEVQYRRSSDQGSTWTAEHRIASNATITPTEALAVSGSDVYVIYLGDIRASSASWGGTTIGNIYLAHSGDAGLNWDAPCQLSTSDDVYRMSIDASRSRIDVVWGSPGGPIYYRGSQNHGSCGSWGAIKNIGGANANRPRVASWGSYVHVVWEASDAGRAMCWTISSCLDNYYVRSTNGGATFEAVQHITRYPMNLQVIGRPAITVLPDSGRPVFFFQNLDPTDLSNQQIYSQTSRSYGAAGSWSMPVRIMNLPNTDNHPVVTASGDTAFISWTNSDTVSDTNDPWFSMAAGGADWVAPEQVSSQNTYATAVAVTPNWAHVTYSPFSGGPLYYRRRTR